MARPARLGERIKELLTRKHLLSAIEITQTLAAIGVLVNKTSVYRALDQLESAGSICKQSLGDDTSVYELRDSHHDHLICSRCGDIQSVACVTQTPVQAKHFQIDHHHTTFFGTCARCSLP